MKEDKKTNKTKGFFSRLAEKLDKKLEEKSKSKNPCCCQSQPKDKSCCS